MSTGLLQNKDPRSFPYKQSSHVGKRFPSPDCRSSAPPQKHTETLVKFGKKLVLHGFAGIHFVDSIQYLKKSLSGQKRSRVFFVAFFWFNAHHSNKPTALLGQWLLTYFMFFANESEKRDMPPHRMEKLLDVLLKASIGNFFEHLYKEIWGIITCPAIAVSNLWPLGLIDAGLAGTWAWAMIEHSFCRSSVAHENQQEIQWLSDHFRH